MSIYYIISSSGAGYQLDATTQISYKEEGKLTSFPVESGDSVSDHYTDDPVTFSVRGIITDVKTPSTNDRSRTTSDFIQGVVDLKRNRDFFSFHYGTKIGVFENCLFESLEFTQTPTHGSSGVSDSFEISATVKQVRLATRAALQPFRDPTVRDDYQDKTKGAASTDEEDPQDLLDTAVIMGAEADVLWGRL